MIDLRWVLLAFSLVACEGKSVSDGPTAAAGEPAGGSSSSGGASNGGSATCLNGGNQLRSLVAFSFESNEALWIRRGCDVEYTLSKVCKPGATSITTQRSCDQLCDSAVNGCGTCGACPDSAVQLSQFGANEQHVLATWDGYAYTAGMSSSGCACYNRAPAGSGSYTIAITGYLSQQDALMQKNGFPFETTFEYPAPDGIVHVPLDFMGL